MTMRAEYRSLKVKNYILQDSWRWAFNQGLAEPTGLFYGEEPEQLPYEIQQ